MTHAPMPSATMTSSPTYPHRPLTLAFLVLAAAVSPPSSSSAFVAPRQRRHHCHHSRSSLPSPRRSAITPRLSMSKNSDRARAEKNLEDMMGDDWRVFRAQLVLQEQREAEEEESANAKKAKKNFIEKAFSDDGKKTHHHGEDDDEKLAKQGQLGDLFASILSSFFGGGKAEGKDDDHASVVDDVVSSAYEDAASIFKGDSVGRASIPVMPGKNVRCDDPFATEAEMPLFLDCSSKVQIDKHRWAHPIPHIEPGCVLVAGTKLGGVFFHTVVLVIDHNEAAGSTGIVINRPLGGNLRKIVSEQPDSNIDVSLKLAFRTSPVTYGGPVLKDEYSILHGYGQVDGSKKLCPGVYVGGSEELMNDVRSGHLPPEKALFVKGHAAWVPGQLSREVEKGAWTAASVSSDFILRYAGAPTSDDDDKDDLWSDILTCMGGKYEEMARKNSGRGDDTRMMMP